ncbi:armadillo-type protein [Mycena floridula]|nr:armadillo-type protein [Mycena floridula]
MSRSTGQKSQRQYLGVIRFIGELYKVQMLTERIMHESIKRLLGEVERRQQKNIESVYQLLEIIGSDLDTRLAHYHMEVYLARIRELANTSTVASRRIKLMSSNLLELRERKWVIQKRESDKSTNPDTRRAPPKAGDLSKFKELSNMNGPMTFGPASLQEIRRKGFPFPDQIP